MKVEEKIVAARFTFDVDQYKQRLASVIEQAGGVSAFADNVGVSYQVAQGWAKGSLPRSGDWGKLEENSRGMAWFLFGIEDEMPTDNNLDRKAAMAAIERLEQMLDTLKMIVRDAAPDGKVEGAGFTKQKRRSLPAQTTKKVRGAKK